MTPKITNVSFKLLSTPSLLDERVYMVVESESPLSRAVSARVRVGEQEGRLGMFRLTDGALTVYLKDEPAEGDVVRVGWHDGGELEDTTFTYQRQPNV
jgi:hypothetical protein